MEFSVLAGIGIILVYLLLIVGAVGAFLPILPGPAIAFVGVLLFKIFVPNSPVSWTFIIVSGLLTAVAQMVDFLMSWVGAKKFGATWKGALGAFVGAIVGIFIPPPLLWIFIGPLVGAFAFEFLGGAGLKVSTKAGLGAFIGTVLASVFKFIVIVFMALYFTLEVAFFYWG